MTLHRVSLALCLVVAFLLAGCAATAPPTQSEREQLHEEAQAAINGFVRRDPSLRDRFDNAYGYAIFPSIGKGGAFMGGGALGWGELYEEGELIGYVRLTQGTVGPQLGGQSYSQVIFFEHEHALRELVAGDLTFSAQVSAVAATRGASLDASYEEGVMVFTMSRGGLMAEASVGGQEFEFVPASHP